MIYVWFAVMIAAVVIEMVTPSALITIWFAIGGAAAALLTYFGMSITIQIIAFLIVSILALVVIRPMAAKYLRGNTIATNADRFVGEVGVVTKDITENKWGEVLVKSTYWSAVALNGGTISMDKKVKVMAIEGAKLIVKEIE